MSRPLSRRRRAAAALGLALAGCVTFGGEALPGDTSLPPMRPGSTLPPPPPLPPPAPPPELPAAARVADDRLRPGMLVAIDVVNEPTLSLERAPIGPDGQLFFPFLGRVPAAGLSPVELGLALARELDGRGYLISPQVDVTVLERSGHRAYVLGRVGRPGAYDLPFDRALTITQLIAMAGGLSTSKADLEADPSAIRLIREVDGERRSFRISFFDIVSRGDLAKDVPIQDGDVLYVPPKQELFIFGAVKKPGGFPLADGSRMQVDEVLQLSGGFTDDADDANLLLIRRAASGATQTYRIPSEPLARAEVEVTTGDTVIVPARRGNRVFVIGQVDRPGAIPLDQPGLTVIRVLSLAGGQTRIASGNVNLIRRVDGQARVFEVPVGAILASGNLDRDPLVEPGDLIVVPEGFF